MERMDFGTAQSNWKPTEEREVKEAIQWCFDGQSADVEDTIQAENCILLEPADVSSSSLTIPACQLVLTCPATIEMQHISVLSEARIIEVYGHHNEYLQTCRSDLVEEVDDMAVFRTDIALERPLLTCCLKFTSLKSKRTMWLYGARVIVAKVKSLPSLASSRIPLYSVEQRLNSMEPKLSEKAELFKTLVEGYQSSQTTSNTDFSALAPMLQMINMLAPNKKRDSVGDAKLLEGSLPSSRSSDKDQAQHTKQKSSRSAEQYDFNENLSSKHVDMVSDTNSNFQPYVISDSVRNHGANFTNGNQGHVLQDKGKEYLPPSMRGNEQDTLEFCTRLEKRLTRSIYEQLKVLEHELLEKVETRMQEIEQRIAYKLDEILTIVKSQNVK